MRRIVFILIILLVFAGLGWLIYSRMHSSGAHEGMGGPQGPVPVNIVTLTPQDVQIWLDFSGRLQAVEDVAVRPRVTGTIEKVYFEPGQMVKEGEALFLIDPRPFQAEANRAEAALNSARAQADLARIEAERAQRLIGENAISQREFEERKSRADVAQAEINAASAQLRQAGLNVQYATITAPVGGKISRAEITEGNLVDPSMPQALTRIVSLDPIYVDFEVDEVTYLTQVRQMQDSPANAIPLKVSAMESDRKIYLGKVLTFDNVLDSNSGTIRVRGLIDNPDHILVPGMYAQVAMGSPEAASFLLVPESAIGTDQNKKFIYVVSIDNKVEYREVTLGPSHENMRIILSGVQDGDKVITEGLQKLRPGAPVEAKEDQEKPAIKSVGDAVEELPLREKTIEPEELQTTPEETIAEPSEDLDA